ncbi:MAG: ricin-type beta-trefoil lectin domain protein [Chloroflexi bacterium]|nr:ricin-type beta-trefoil lectin domain protein [Chloroflexota bacterium]
MRVLLVCVIIAAAAIAPSGGVPARAAGLAGDCCGDRAAWTTGNKQALGTSADPHSTVWFTVANGVTTEVFYPRADMPNMQDMQYVVTDGRTFVDLERDATDHQVALADPKALEYTITNTAKSRRYRLTNTYVTDSNNNTLVIRTRFESLDGGAYQLFILENPSTAGDGGMNDAFWDPSGQALISTNTQALFNQASPIPVASALKSSSPFIAHTNGYAGAASDCLVDLRAHQLLSYQLDGVAAPGNVVQCAEVGVDQDTTFTLALGYGADPVTALAAADNSLAAGFTPLERAYQSGWHAYLDGLKPPPLSVASDAIRRQVYNVALMALRAAEDKTYPGASVAGLATPWGDFADGTTLNDGYHRVWGRDLYQQATGLLAAGDATQPLRMAQFMWNAQYVSTVTPGDNTTYVAGSFPRYSPVSGVSGTPPKLLGCCEQFDQDAFAILLAWTTGLTDSDTFVKIKQTANHLVNSGPDTTERWEELGGKSPSSIAAEIAGLIAAADVARLNGDEDSASRWEATADNWRASLNGWTLTSNGYWGDHHYFERITRFSDPNDDSQICSFQEGCFFNRDVVDFGFLELARLGVRPADDQFVAASIGPTASAFDGNSAVQVILPNGDVYFHRYEHDNYGESNVDCSGWPAGGASRFGRLWPVLSGERGEYELANGRSASIYLQSMADAANAGYFIPEQVWDRADLGCYRQGTATGSAAPLMWAEGQYLRLAQAIDAGYPVDTPSVVRARYGGPVTGPIVGMLGKCLDVRNGDTLNGTPIQVWDCNGTAAQRLTWNTGDGAIHVLGKCVDVTGGVSASGTPVELWDCNGTGAQQWAYAAWNRLRNSQSGRCLDVPGSDATSGTQLQIADCDGSSGQTWHLP